MKLTLLRQLRTETSTIGELHVDSDFECVTLEDPVRDKKIKGATAIPYGTYAVTIENSKKFKRDMPRLGNVPNFKGILIHWGNTAKDTEGCILVGKSKGKNQISSSKAAFKALFRKLKKTADAGQSITIDILKS